MSWVDEEKLKDRVYEMDAEIARLRGLLTLWWNYAPMKVSDIRPNKVGKTLGEMTREALKDAADAAEGRSIVENDAIQAEHHG